MFGGMGMPNLDSDGLKTQAQHIWSMLDDMAANDPAAYRKFIDRQMKEGKESVSPPKPHMCVQTCTFRPKQPIYINFCGWHRIPEPKTEEDPIPVIGGQLQTVKDEKENYRLVAVSFHPKVLEEFGLDAKKAEEQDALVNLAIDYLQDQHKLTISRQYKIMPRDFLLKGSLENLLQTFRPQAAKGDEKLEKELEELEKTFGPIAAGAKDTVLNQLKNISISDSDAPRKATSHQPEIVLETGKLNPPIKRGLIEEIGVKSADEHSCTCPEYSLKTDINMLVMVVKLPGVTTVKDCELDISEDDMSLTVPRRYKLYLKLPQRIHDEEARAKFNKKQEQLTINMPTR